MFADWENNLKVRIGRAGNERAMLQLENRRALISRQFSAARAIKAYTCCAAPPKMPRCCQTRKPSESNQARM